MSEDDFDDDYDDYGEDSEPNTGAKFISPDISGMNLIINAYMLPENLKNENVIDISVFGCSVSEDILNEKGLSRLYINNVNRTEYFNSGISFPIANITQKNADKIIFVLEAMDEINPEEARKAAFRAAFVSDFKIFNRAAAEKLNNEWIKRQNYLYSRTDFDDDAKYNHIADELIEFSENCNPESPLGQNISAAFRYTVSSVVNSDTAQVVCYKTLQNNALTHLHGFAKKHFMKRFPDAGDNKFGIISDLILDNESSAETRIWAWNIWKDTIEKTPGTDISRADTAYSLYMELGPDTPVSEHTEDYIIGKISCDDEYDILEKLVVYTDVIDPEYLRLHSKLADGWENIVSDYCALISPDDENYTTHIRLRKALLAGSTIEECRPGCETDKRAKSMYMECIISLPVNNIPQAKKELERIISVQTENFVVLPSMYRDPETLDIIQVENSKAELRKCHKIIQNDNGKNADAAFYKCIQIINNCSDTPRGKFRNAYNLLNKVCNTENAHACEDLLLKTLKPEHFADFNEYSEIIYDCYTQFGNGTPFGKKLISNFDNSVDFVIQHMGENAAALSLIYMSGSNEKAVGFSDYAANRLADIIRKSDKAREMLEIVKDTITELSEYSGETFILARQRTEMLENEFAMKKTEEKKKNIVSGPDNIPG